MSRRTDDTPAPATTPDAPAPAALQVGEEARVLVFPNDQAAPGEASVRPARLVRAWTPDCANLRVDLDGANDAAAVLPGHAAPLADCTAAHVTSAKLVRDEQAARDAGPGASVFFRPAR
jgi:hypothetical protein